LAHRFAVMRPPKLLLLAVVAVAAAAVLPFTLRAREGETASRAAPPTVAHAQSAEKSPERPAATPARPRQPKIHWRRSVAVGSPSAGRLVRGVQLPAHGLGFSTWDPNLHRSPDRGWRRWGTAHLVRELLAVASRFHTAHPGARELLIGDLSRQHGGDFGRQYGYVWHASHQNGLDADVYYPRKDRKRRAPRTAADIDRRLSQDLLDRFVRAGATKVFVGPNTGLTGPSGVVQVLAQHDDHMHVRFAGSFSDP
jgi:murein endopeptidase